MRVVDRDAMSPSQRAAWNQLWRDLLSPQLTEEARSRESLATRATTGETATANAATGRNSNGSERRNV
jgi:hypothetical protein